MLVVAENEVLRVGVAALISQHDDLTAVGTCLERANLEDVVRDQQHDVLVVESGADAPLLGLLDARRDGALRHVPVLALLSEQISDLGVLSDLVACGVDGIVTGSDGGPQLGAALRAVHSGHRWLSPVLGGRFLEVLVRAEPATPSPVVAVGCTGLSPRERDVLVLVADGLTVAQIAKRSHRSQSAVKYHLSNMCARFQASNRAHLVYLAVQAGELSTN